MFCSHCVSVMNDKFMLDILINDVQLTLSLSDNTEKQTLFKNILYYRKAFYNFFNINHAVLNDVEFKINKKSINFINENDNFIDWTDFKNCYFYLHVNKLTSSTFINLVFMTKTWFTDAKLENAKSVKNNITDQQQNSDDIIDSFNMLNQLSKASLNKTSSSKAFKLSAFYQYLDCSCVNVQTWHCYMCYMNMYKILKLCQIARDIDINDMSASKQLCEVCIQDKSHKYVNKAFWYSTS